MCVDQDGVKDDALYSAGAQGTLQDHRFPAFTLPFVEYEVSKAVSNQAMFE